MSYTTITVPNPIPPNTNFSLYYTNSVSNIYPSIQPPNTTYQLTKQGVNSTIYSSFNANTRITTQTLSEPLFFTRDSQGNIYFTNYNYLGGDTSGGNVCVLNKNGTAISSPTIAISNATGSFSIPSGITMGLSDNELWVADVVSGNGVLKKFVTGSSGNWNLSTTYTPSNIDPPYINQGIQGIKYKDGLIYACYSGTPGAIYTIDTSGSTTQIFNTYIDTNTDTPQDLVFDSSGNLYFVNNNTEGYGSLVKFDGSIPTVIITSSYISGLNTTNNGIFGNPGGLIFNSDYTKIYITGSSSKSIFYYTIGVPNVLSAFITDGFPSGSGNSGLYNAYGIIFDSKNNMYVANQNSGTNEDPAVANGYIQKIQGLQFNFENIAGLDPGSYPVNVYNSSSASVVSGTTFNIGVQCFLAGTKILTYVDGHEEWKCIENLKPLDLVKTYLHGYIPIKNIGWTPMINSIHTNPNKLYKIKKNKLPELTDDLYVSGKHSRLVDNLTHDQEVSTLKIWSKLLKIDDKYLLMACVDELFTDVKDDNKYEVYQIILESESSTQQYGIYANGLLSESMSINTFLRKAQLVRLY